MIQPSLCSRIMLLISLLYMGQNLFAQGNASFQTNDQILKHILDADQNIRQTLDSLQTDNASMEQVMSIYQEMARQDLDNQRIAFPILNIYLAGEINLSKESLYALYFIIQHADGDAQMKYQGFIKTLFDKQIISNIEYGMFVDRLNVRQNKMQLFGFQCYMNIYTQDRFLYPISSKAEERRAEIGLEDNDFDDFFSGEYAPLYILPSEYVIFGHALRQTGQNGKFKGISAEVSVGQIKVSTNDIGFYAIKLNKDDVPESLNFIIEGKQYPQRIHNVSGANWEIIDFMITQ